MSPINLIVGAVLLLFATTIGDEELPSESMAPPSTGSLKPKKNPNEKPLGRDHAAFKDLSQISKKVFLRSFRRQAVELNLQDCLRSGGIESGSVLMAAQLKPTGALEAVRPVENTSRVPECGLELIAKMKFVESGKEIKGASHTIIWRVDW